MKSGRLGLGVAGGVLLLAGCPIERLAPDQVAMGMARLTVRNAGNLVALTEADAQCGFSSQGVLDSAARDGEVGGEGSLTWTVTGCTLDLGGLHEIDKDCNGDTTSAGGRVTVSGTKTLRGHLTGNPANPVVPAGPNAITFSLNAEFDGYVVQASGSNAWLTLKGGQLTFDAAPHLGQSISLGVCAVATSDLTLSNVVYHDGKALVHNGNRNFSVDVPTSQLEAQVGRWADKENTLTGEITVWTSKQTVPSKKDHDGLDPEYNYDKHLNSLACKDDLVQPLTYECKSLRPQLAEGLARLTVATFGNVVSITDANTTCGFSAASVSGSATLTGTQGRPGGQAVWTISSPCTIQIPAGTVVSEDCNGVKTTMSGTMHVRGTKTVRGMLSGDALQPVVPDSRDPAEIVLQADLSDLTFSMSNGNNVLVVKSGGLSGNVKPRVAKDTVTGACSISTPVVEFSNVTWANGQVQLSADGNKFNLGVSTSNLTAQNGTKNGRTNYLDGTITVEGEQFTVPLDRNALVLDPTFDEAAFTRGYACKPHQVIPASDADCSFTTTLTDGAARLLVQNFGIAVQLADADTHCGFSSTAVNNAVTLTGQVGERGGQAVWTVSNCALDFAMPLRASTDCQGVATTVVGRAVVSGTKTLRGIRTGDSVQPIVPLSRDPAEVALNVTFTDFKVSTSNSINALTIKSGQVSGTVKPRVGIDTTVGACALSTPVVEFSNLLVSNAALGVGAGPKTFVLNVSNASINAQNGNKDARTNYLQGTMTVDGEAKLVPSDQAHPVLNPDYNQQQFDLSYACTPHLRVATSEADCNFYRVLGENASRLLIQTAGTIGTMVNMDTSCGFENLIVKGTPDEVNGDPGNPGFLRWQITGCQVGWDNTHTFQSDCNGGQLNVTGQVDVDAGRTVHGLRETLALFFDSIRPTERNDVEIRLDAVRFLTDFDVSYVDPTTGAPKGYLVIHDGILRSRINPILGERASDRGMFDVAVPVPVSTSDTTVQAENITATLYSEGKQFNLRIPTASVDGYNGSWMGRINDLDGTIQVDNETFTLNSIPLNPDYTPASFQAGYICTADLAGPIPSM